MIYVCIFVPAVRHTFCTHKKRGTVVIGEHMGSAALKSQAEICKAEKMKKGSLGNSSNYYHHPPSIVWCVCSYEIPEGTPFVPQTCTVCQSLHLYNIACMQCSADNCFFYQVG